MVKVHENIEPVVTCSGCGGTQYRSSTRIEALGTTLPSRMLGVVDVVLVQHEDPIRNSITLSLCVECRKELVQRLYHTI